MSENKLPNKPSALIRLALKDLSKVEKDRRYKVNMYSWHVPSKLTKRCSVCLAGSVMAKSLGAIRSTECAPSNFEETNKLRAIDYFRTGNISWGASRLGFDISHPADQDIVVSVTTYEVDPVQFKKDMLKIATTFESIGL